eukprot:TRINITY_DN1494_c0_g1_i1.p1 TRINITY_DN1494_c0_g1~~TRINITY_DN1494_c0_g1_i1.p1  ORF type:complete len:236 (+),score=42.88 TRINITY_DN1494_c0_g1_i1:97-804(+)
MDPKVIGLVASTGLGVGLIVYGFLKHQAKVMQFNAAPSISLENLRSEMDQFYQSRGGKRDSHDGLYCKLNGTTGTDGTPFSAPLSRMKAVIHESPNSDRQMMSFNVQDSESNPKVKVEVNSKGAIIFLQKYKWSNPLERFRAFIGRRPTELLLQVGRPLFVIGEVVYEHGDRLVVREPYYGKGFVVSAYSEEDTVKIFDRKAKLFMGSGTAFLCVAAYFATQVIGERTVHLFAPM